MDGYQKVNDMLIFLDTEFTALRNPELWTMIPWCLANSGCVSRLILRMAWTACPRVTAI